jgi:hypothetical protein
MNVILKMRASSGLCWHNNESCQQVDESFAESCQQVGVWDFKYFLWQVGKNTSLKWQLQYNLSFA